METKNFSGLTVLITGASSGIGLAFSNALAEKGANLILSARSEDKLKELANTLTKKWNTSVKAVPCDLSKTGGAKRLFEQTRGSTIDILINCAGFGRWTEFCSEHIDRYNNMIELNIKALVELNHLLLPLMDKNKMSGVINVASTAAFQPVPYQSVYAASKSFVLSFSEALAGEYKEKGIRVLALCPGYTDTNFMKVANGRPEGMAQSTPDEVVISALKAFIRRKSYVVPGKSNYINSLLPRVLSRQAVINIVSRMFRNRILTA